MIKILLPLYIFGCSLITAQSADYYYETHQVATTHRHDVNAMGAHWGHHLGHMVRTANYGLWYVDDTGTSVYSNPAAKYYHFEGTHWTEILELSIPPTVQQNTSSMAVGDTIYTYGLNINGGYIEEAVFDPRTGVGLWNRRILSTGSSTNYIGAAVSPGGTRVVWWTRVVDAGGPSYWRYAYNDGSGWSAVITSTIPGNDFSYVVASFVDDNSLYVAGEVPGGTAPTWTYKMGAGLVTLGQPMTDFTTWAANYTAHSIWVNSSTGNVHLFGQAYSGAITYFLRTPGGDWSADLGPLPVAGRFRVMEDASGKVYFVVAQYGFKMLVTDKSSINGAIDFSTLPVINLNLDEGFTIGGAIWSESDEMQTAAVQGLNFGSYGNDWDYSNLIRHTQVKVNTGEIKLNLSLPSGDEMLESAMKRTISWYYNPSAGITSVDIDWSADGGTTWSVVVEGVPNNGAYVWQVPDTASTDNYIRISDSADPAVSHTNTRPFILYSNYVPNELPVGTITVPHNDVTITVNDVLHAEGTGTDAEGGIIRYEWDTGDGTIYSGLTKTSIDHQYTQTGAYDLKFKVKDIDGAWSLTDSVHITVAGAASIDPSALPKSLELRQNYPNPFNPETTIYYELPRTMMVNLEVFDIMGRKVATLVTNVRQVSGNYKTVWSGTMLDGADAPSGYYFCALTAGSEKRINKMLLLR